MQNILLQKLQKLTLVVYRITDCFPQDEILKRQMRKIANGLLLSFNIDETNNNIVVNESIAASNLLTNLSLTKKGKRDIIDKVSKLRMLFLIARQQNWVDFKNFDFLDRYCRECVEDVMKYYSERDKKFSNKTRTDTDTIPTSTDAEDETELTNRQKKFLSIISQGGRAQFSDLQSFFKDTADRTLRRDIQILCSLGIIKREGKHPGFFYTLLKN